MTFTLEPGALQPDLVMTLTDTDPIDTSGGVVIEFTDEAGALLFTDTNPTVDATNPLAVLVSHAWVAGQTDRVGTYGARALVGGEPWPDTTWQVGNAGALYATVAQARAAGATGSDAEVTAALQAARRRIDRFTGDTFTPTAMELVARVSTDGTALLPRTVRRVDTVTMVGSSTPMAGTAYRVLSSRTPGQVDAVLVGGVGYGDPLIAGAEPWNGGWANLLGSYGTGQVEVVGSFGWDEPPLEVVTAAAQLAAVVTAGTLPVSGTVGPDTDDEGNVVKVTSPVPGTSPVKGARTTGDAAADALLAALVRNPVRLAGV